MRLNAILGSALFGLAVLAGLLIGRWTGFLQDRETVSVNVREGEPSLAADSEALIILDAALVEEIIENRLSTAEVPGELRNIDAALVDDGIRITGDERFKVVGVPLTVGFTTLAVPGAQEDGTLGVRLTDTKALGGSLPGFVEEIIQNEANEALTSATNIGGYTVREVEVGEGELLVYLSLSDGALDDLLQ